MGVVHGGQPPRPDRSARLRAHGSHDASRGGRSMDDAGRSDCPLSRLLRHERPRPPARNVAGAGQSRRARHGGCAAPPGPARASMSTNAGEHDVAIVGASTAGCTAARLFALRGARVALIERRPALDAYKTVCTHYIQSSATPTIEKLGLARLLEERGAVHNSIDLWTRDSGWIGLGDVEAPYGYSITRRSLDPILRKLAADTPGVELIAGWTAVGLLGDGRPGSVEIEDRGHNRVRLNARLVVAADGRDSKLPRLARVPGRVKPHGRFFYWAYWS